GWRDAYMPQNQRDINLNYSNAGDNCRQQKKTIAYPVKEFATQFRLAAEMCAEDITIVATAAVRGAPNRDDLTTAITAETGLPVRVLTGSEEAHLDFIGATKRLGAPVEGSIVVVDVGGGSTELAIGTV